MPLNFVDIFELSALDAIADPCERKRFLFGKFKAHFQARCEKIDSYYLESGEDTLAAFVCGEAHAETIGDQVLNAMRVAAQGTESAPSQFVGLKKKLTKLAVQSKSQTLDPGEREALLAAYQESVATVLTEKRKVLRQAEADYAKNTDCQSRYLAALAEYDQFTLALLACAERKSSAPQQPLVDSLLLDTIAQNPTLFALIAGRWFEAGNVRALPSVSRSINRRYDPSLFGQNTGPAGLPPLPPGKAVSEKWLVELSFRKSLKQVKSGTAVAPAPPSFVRTPK